MMSSIEELTLAILEKGATNGKGITKATFVESTKLEILKKILETTSLSPTSKIAELDCFRTGTQKNPHSLGFSAVHQDREEGGIYINSWISTVGRSKEHAQSILQNIPSYFNSDLVWAKATLSLAQSELHEMTMTPCSIYA
jgi:hypothetical protein